jgi:multidrug efflux pump subunit AcrA (membrane-fusion protein)
LDLVPVLKKSAPQTNATNITTPTTTKEYQPGEFNVPIARQQQIGVTYGTIQKVPFRHRFRALGTVADDKERGKVASVWAQFYQDELPLLKVGLAAVITTSSYPGEKFSGKISSVDLSISDALRTGRARIDVADPDSKMFPNLRVDVELVVDMGEGLGVPFDAVLPTGRHNIVFIDKGGGRLEARYVELGRKYGDYYEVKSGLSENERVVTSANFLIDAEANIQGALKSW